jgi:hypothetical protein
MSQKNRNKARVKKKGDKKPNRKRGNTNKTLSQKKQRGPYEQKKLTKR